jgi:hypothetical protein
VSEACVPHTYLQQDTLEQEIHSTIHLTKALWHKQVENNCLSMIRGHTHYCSSFVITEIIRFLENEKWLSFSFEHHHYYY